MKKTVLLVLAVVVVGVVAARAYKTMRGRAHERACHYYVDIGEHSAHYPTSYYRQECLSSTGEPRWWASDVPRGFYDHPYSVTPNPSASESWNIVAAGDIMAPGDLQLGAFMHRNDPGESSGGYDWVFAGIRDVVSSADLAIGNLETPVVPSIPRAGLWRFNVDPVYLDALKGIGFDVLMTANNHTLDYGIRGIEETQQELAKRNLINVGTSPPGKEWQRSVVVDVGDSSIARVAFLNYTLEINRIRFFQSYRYVDYLLRGKCINWFDTSFPRSAWEHVLRFGRNALFGGSLYINRDEFLESVTENVRLARRDGAEYVILFLHWGEAERAHPRHDQRELALELCLLGVDAIIGAGPHMIQPIERVYTMDDAVLDARQDGAREHFIAYSLGNLVSHHLHAASYGMLIDMRLARGPGGVYLQSAEPHIVKSVWEETTLPAAKGGTVPLTTYRTQIVDMSEFLRVFASGEGPSG